MPQRFKRLGILAEKQYANISAEYNIKDEIPAAKFLVKLFDMDHVDDDCLCVITSAIHPHAKAQKKKKEEVEEDRSI